MDYSITGQPRIHIMEEIVEDVKTILNDKLNNLDEIIYNSVSDSLFDYWKSDIDYPHERENFTEEMDTIINDLSDELMDSIGEITIELALDIDENRNVDECQGRLFEYRY